jgi:hypothetical protein
MEDKDLLIDFDHIKILAYEDLSDEQKKEVNTICESEGISLSEDMPEELYPDSLLNAESDDIE